MLGSLALKFGIFYAGKDSAQDPLATFRQQRERERSGSSQ
jgi:hypothetical protein